MSKFAALAIEVEKPGRMAIVHPGTGIALMAGDAPAHIDVLSADSVAARAHQRGVQRRRIEAARNRVRAAVSPEEVDADHIDLLVALTAGWQLAGLDGRPLDVPFSAENARELYSEPAFAWLRDQVDQFAADRANFSKASSPA